MFFLSVALFAEARPLIRHFRLKRVHAPGRFQRFAGDGIRLVVSGTGSLSAAVATAHLLTDGRAGEGDTFFNIGLCGAVDGDFTLGQTVLCHKIVDHGTKRAYYPDILVRHGLRETVLETFSHPVRRENIPCGTEGHVADMEGAGCFVAASAFLPPHRLYFLKIVSDFLETDTLSSASVSRFMENAIPHLESLMHARASIAVPGDRPLFDQDDLALLQLADERLRLTETMRHQLRRYAAQYKIRTRRNLSCLSDLLNVTVQSKPERKKRFERLKQRLLHE
jgi:adenosylhomocysteine nucleosidase